MPKTESFDKMKISLENFQDCQVKFKKILVGYSSNDIKFKNILGFQEFCMNPGHNIVVVFLFASSIVHTF